MTVVEARKQFICGKWVGPANAPHEARVVAAANCSCHLVPIGSLLRR